MPASRTGARRRSASTATWSERVSPRSTNSTKPGHAAHESSTGTLSSAMAPW